MFTPDTTAADHSADATNAQRWRVWLDDGRRAFAKLAVDDQTAGWLRND